jgi:hypothetical protein
MPNQVDWFRRGEVRQSGLRSSALLCRPRNGDAGERKRGRVSLWKGVSRGGLCTDRLIVRINVSGTKGQPLMKLDSGSNAPMQYEAGKEPPLQTRDAAGIKREFVVLPLRMFRSVLMLSIAFRLRLR